MNYTKLEVVTMLVHVLNTVMKELSIRKDYVIYPGTEGIVCYQRNVFFKDKETSRQTFDELIDDVGGKHLGDLNE